MQIKTTNHDLRMDVALQGRMDAFSSTEVQKQLNTSVSPDIVCAVFDMSEMDYISSAGLRLLLSLHKQLQKRGGRVVLSGAKDYCRNVIDMAGFTNTFSLFDKLDMATAYCDTIIRDKQCLEQWDGLERIDLECGSVRILPGSKDAGAVYILGDIKDVLYARITPAHMCSKRFSETEYSIGLGGLGDQPDDYFPLMGEMITIGGTMVWLPTDGHDTPDFLIPKSDKGQILLRTAFNTAIAGRFNEVMLFDSWRPAGATTHQLYRDLFGAAMKRRPDFKGVLALVIRAQMGAVFGSGIKKSPIRESAPANGKMIVHQSNAAEWFDFDSTPRYTGVTALICGIGADLTIDLTDYDQEQLNRVFYLNPANIGGKNELLHNHAVIFNEQPLADRAVSLEQEIASVVDHGDFIDMRHLLDSSTIVRALLGVSYIQEFRSDPGEIHASSSS